MGAAAVVVEEDDGGVICPFVGGGDPIPGATAGGGEAKAGAEIFLIGQFVEGFEVQGLKTIDLPRFRPPTFFAGPAQLKASGLDGGFVLVQLQESFGKKLSQFAFDRIRLRIQQAVQIRIVGGVDLIGALAGTEFCDRTANSRGDDQQGGGEDEGAEDEENKLVHALMILQSMRETDGGSPAIY